ncbi:MAG TPA: MarR family winged helix-turn-helix transcriptional regulator [Acidimicrobiales bacterium]|jgi:DNA-binding MarR family transcriptional regulator
MVDDQAPLGPSLRRAWLGYQRRLDEAMAAAGFDDRAFPNGRVLRLCAGSDDVTISEIGRQLGVSRQRSAQIVTVLLERGYVTVRPSSLSAREKVVRPTKRALAYLDAHRTAARRIERDLVRQVGPDSLAALRRLTDVLAGEEDLRMRDYLREKRQSGGLRYPEE